VRKALEPRLQVVVAAMVALAAMVLAEVVVAEEEMVEVEERKEEVAKVSGSRFCHCVYYRNRHHQVSGRCCQCHYHCFCRVL